MEQRAAAFHELFNSFDLDGNGTVGVQELHQVMQATGRQGSRGHAKVVAKFEAQLAQAVREATIGSDSPRGEAGFGGIGHVLFGVDGEPGLDPAAFAHFMADLTKDYDEPSFQDFCKSAMDAVDAAKEATVGSGKKKLAWQLFQVLDTNGDGHVDLNELEVLLDVSNKTDKKEVAKWKAVVTQKHHNAVAGTGEAADPAKVRMTLADFQHFMEEYTGGSEDKLTVIAETVQDEVSAKYDQYLREKNIDEIFDMIKNDLCRERPHDALAGIRKSVERIARVGIFSSQLARRRSMARLDATLAGSRSGTKAASPPPEAA